MDEQHDELTDRLRSIPGFSESWESWSIDNPTMDERHRRSFLETVPILRNLNDRVLWWLARSAVDGTFEDGQSVVRQGDQERERLFYIVRDGAADVLVRGDDGEESNVASLVSGDYFGELGLLADAPRSATIRAAGTLNVIAFDAVTFLGVIAEQVLIFRIVRSQRHKDSGAIRIHELGLFSDMPLQDLPVILRDAEERHYPASTTIFEQDDPGDRFHIILDGRVEVIRDGNVIASLHTGEFFGETALLFGCPRTATIRATAPTVVWSIGRDSFERVVRHSLLDNTRNRQTVLSRLRKIA